MPKNAATMEGMLWAERVRAASSGMVCSIYVDKGSLCDVSHPAQRNQDFPKSTCSIGGRAPASAPLLLQVIPEMPWETFAVGE